MIIGMNGWVMKRYSEIFLKKERKKEKEYHCITKTLGGHGI
jgi:hypothetical protein